MSFFKRRTTAPVTKHESPSVLMAAASVAIDGGDQKPWVKIEAYAGGIMHVPPWGPVVIDLDSLDIQGDIAIVVDHNTELRSTVGSGSAAVEFGRLFVEGPLTAATPAGEQILRMHKDGIRFQASIGIEVHDSQAIAAGQSINVNGRLIDAPHDFTLVTSGKLREVSICSVGCDANTSVSIAAQHKGISALQTAPEIPAHESQLQAMRQAAAARLLDEERQRHDKIMALAASYPGQTQAVIHGITNGLTADQVELEMLRASRSAPAVHIAPQRSPQPAVGGRPEEADVLTASLCLSAGMSEGSAGKQFGESCTHEALSARYRGAGLHSVCHAVIRAAGGDTALSGRFSNATLKEAFQASRSLQAAFTTVSLPGILGNAANKLLIDRYAAVQTTWEKFCAVESNSDFKVHKRYRLVPDTMGGGIGFAEVDAVGHLPGGGLQEVAFDSQLKTYGQVINLPREVLINDDLGAFAQIPKDFGREAAKTLERIVYSNLLAAQDTFFSSGNQNYASGTSNPDTRLGIAGLSNASRMFKDQTDENGDPAMIVPYLLLVPTALSDLAKQLINSTELRDTTANTRAPIGNPHHGSLSLAESPWLGSSNLAGSSSDAWYLFSNPNDVAAMEVAFLDGNRSPTIEEGEMSFTQLGMAWRVYWDFGVAMRDHRGAVKMKGAV